MNVSTNVCVFHGIRSHRGQCSNNFSVDQWVNKESILEHNYSVFTWGKENPVPWRITMNLGDMLLTDVNQAQTLLIGEYFKVHEKWIKSLS